MSRLQELFHRKRQRGEKALSIFVTAGYPTRDGTPELVLALEAAGADFVELGVPFSDPMADGPTIQRASRRALANGVNLRRVLQQVKEIRAHSELPLVLMSYLNPLLAYGLPGLAIDAVEAGVDGFIVPDLLPEEAGRLPWPEDSPGCNFLVAPNTPAARLREVDAATRDFVYCVSVTGVTGARTSLPEHLTRFLSRVRENVRHPYVVGFGIASPEEAARLAPHCDGMVVGSALLDRLSQANGYHEATAFVRALKKAMLDRA